MKWFEHPETKVRGYNLKPPYSNVFVGCDPCDGMTRAVAADFDAFVNVSDSPCNYFEPMRQGQQMHWYPVNEMGLWNLSYLFWLKKVLDYHYAAGHRIYLHCHAGAYRSPSAAVLWLQSRGHTANEALTLGKESTSTLYRLWDDIGSIPKLKDEVFRLMNEHPTWSLGGILGEASDLWNHECRGGYYRKLTLLHHYFWFYYEPKWWARNLRRKVTEWFKGYGYHKDGCATYLYLRKHYWGKAKEAEPAAADEACPTGKRWDPGVKAWVLKNNA